MEIPILEIVLQANNVQHCWLWHMEKKKKKAFVILSLSPEEWREASQAHQGKMLIFHKKSLRTFS